LHPLLEGVVPLRELGEVPLLLVAQPLLLERTRSPVHLGHHEVEQDEPRRRLAHTGGRHASVLGLGDGVALAFEQPPDQLAEVRVVVDDEHGQAPPVLGEHGHQPLALDRLREIVGGAERVAQVLVVDDREHDYRNVRERGIGLERRQDRPPVQPGHHHVERDRVGPELPGHP